MVRSFKLKKRTSTLGASREERALSALESSLASGTYDAIGNGQSKFFQRTLSRLGLREAYSMDEQREPVPTSITMEQRNNRRSAPLNTATTFGTITTRSSVSPRRPSRFGRSRSAPRATTRTTSPSKVVRRPGEKSMRSADPSLSSSIPSSVKSTPNTMECEERIEVVQMTNEQNRPFVRILVSKTSYKPLPMENGVEVIPRRNLARSANQHAKRKDLQEIQRNSRRKDQEKAESEPATTPVEECMPPILKTMDTMELSMCASAVDVAEKAVSSCPGPAEESFQGEVNALRRINSLVKSKSGLMNALVKKGEPAVIRSFPNPKEDDQRDDIAAPNYYGIHSLRTDPKSSRRRMLQFRKDDSIDAIVRKEQEKREKELKKEEKKQKQIQKRLDKDAKKQIRKELYKEEMKESSSPSRKNSFNSSKIRKINYINSSRSDNKIYNRTWDESYPQIVKRESSSSASSERFLDQVVASFSRDLEGIPANVSFVSSGEGTTGHGSYESSILSSGTYESIASRDTAAMQEFVERVQGKSIMGGIGNAFFGQPMREDVRDFRMVDSDISISSYGDDDDSTDSSAALRYLNQLRQRTIPIEP